MIYKTIPVITTALDIPCIWESSEVHTNSGEATVVCDKLGQPKEAILVNNQSGKIPESHHALIPIRAKDYIVQVVYTGFKYLINVYAVLGIERIDKVESYDFIVDDITVGSNPAEVYDAMVTKVKATLKNREVSFGDVKMTRSIINYSDHNKVVDSEYKFSIGVQYKKPLVLALVGKLGLTETPEFIQTVINVAKQKAMLKSSTTPVYVKAPGESTEVNGNNEDNWKAIMEKFDLPKGGVNA
jgi:hypothetical protein